MLNMIKKFGQSENGATLVEYGVALILAIVVGGTALSSLATETDNSMGLACTEMQPTLPTGSSVTWQGSATC